MGLFSKFKKSMDGGVELHIQVPSSVAANQIIPVTVTLTADSSQTISSVKAEIMAEARESGMSLGNGLGVHESRSMARAVAEVENREPFTIAPGETKTVNLQLYLNGGAGGPLDQIANVGGAMGGALHALASVAQSFGHVNYLYTVKASADVQGHHMGPNDEQPIQILPAPQAASPAQPTPFAGEMPGQVQPVAPVPSTTPLPGQVQPVAPVPLPGSLPPPQDGPSGQQL